MDRTTRGPAPRSYAFVAIRSGRLWFLAACTLLWAGCPASADEVQPPRDQFYFPTGMTIAPDESVLFVANANSDLRYDSGTAMVVDLAGVDDIAEAWVNDRAEGNCEIDLMNPRTLVCDEREVIRNASVRMGNFATEIKAQTLADGRLRLFAAVRGDPSLTWMDWDGARLSCDNSDGGYPECDDAHRLVQLRNDEDLVAIPDEPFGLFVNSDEGYVAMTHLSNGAVSVADAPPDGDPPMLSDALGGLFAGDANGIPRSVGIAGRQVSSDGASPPAPVRLYVTSPGESRVQTLVVARPDTEASERALPRLVPGEYFFMSRGIANSTNGRGIAFSPAGDRAYIVNRFPPMMHIFDTSADPLSGIPRNEFLSAVEICAEASNLTVTQVEEEGELREHVYLACFRNGQVWSIDPKAGVVDAIIDVGRGPHALVASPTRRRLYVSNNLENTIAVVDLTPGETENRVVLRLGEPQPVGGE